MQNINAVIRAIKIIIRVMVSGLFIFGRVKNIDAVKHNIIVNIIYNYGN
jgi:hypothetical protein